MLEVVKMLLGEVLGVLMVGVAQRQRTFNEQGAKY
jgi:hypothetical protein